MSSPKNSSPASPPEIPSAVQSVHDEPYAGEECCKPDFIYGGPFIKVEKPSPFLNTATPLNIQLQGTYKLSFAYYSLKERLPIILTKVIDYLSREGGKIKSANSGATDEDIRGYIQYITKLKNDLVTNKQYDLLTVDSDEARRWNEWIQNESNSYYFTNIWVFSECYVYRRLREGCELSKGLQNFDPFDDQKDTSFKNSLELMCIVADKLVTMLPPAEKDKRKADFITLLKICLWANKCDLSLSMGEQVSLNKKEAAPPVPPAPGAPAKKGPQISTATSQSTDPFQMIIDFKDKLLVDDTGKIVDQVIAKAEAMAKSVQGPVKPGSEAGSPTKGADSPKNPGSPPKEPSAPAKPEGEGEEPEKIPCPAKMVIPQAVMFDIVCDNAGYELFSDLCLAHFLISQNIVQKIRFHVKKIPWFVSDVTPRDFQFVIDSCKNASFNKEITVEAAEGAEPEPPRQLNADNLKKLGEQWTQYVADGKFVVLCDDFWTSPHVYKDMKKYDFNLYRKLQYAVAILFKGDLNYRKLLGEKNWNPTTAFEPALQGFMPAPVIAVRTVKADLICGLPKATAKLPGKYEQLCNIDDKWMQTGDYGVIQFCGKAEPLKVSDRPCADYGEVCFGTVCPVHNDL